MPFVPPDLLVAYAFVIGSFVAYLLVRTGRGSRGTIRVWYMNEVLPQYLRAGVAILPVLGCAGLAITTSFLLLDVPGAPKTLTLLLFVGAALLMQLSWIIAYRVPPPFLPPWLRAEIDAGIVPVARPTRGDWVLFATFSLLFTGGAILVTVLALPPLLVGP
jgi:hypothetical protein